MRLSPIFVGLSLALAVQASWFGGNDHTTDAVAHPYTTWSATQLRDWLDTHAVTIPKRTPTEAELCDLVADNWNSASSWTYDQYASAQQSFQDLRDSSFDAWDESRLREWLLKQGVVSPKGPKEKLVLMAKEKYRQYQQAASSFSSQASATASTMVHGDSLHQASKSASSLVAKATEPVVIVFDETKDYVYSTWDEAQMKKWLQDKGLLKTKEQKKKDELLQMMHDAWGRVVTPIWSAWSDSYLHNWLVSHNIIKSDVQKNRDYYTDLMKNYYYSTSDSVYDTWTDSQLRNWLIDHGIIKSDAQVTRDKMLKLISDNYISAKDTFWDAWSDNQIKDWLVSHGYMRSDAQVKRDELIKAAEEKYNDVHAKTAAYLTWPDARLRAYLRQHGVSEDMVPGARPGLLQEVRIRYVITENRAESLLDKIRDIVNGSTHKVEDALARIVSLLSMGWIDVKHRSADQYGAVKDGYEEVKGRTEQELKHARKAGEKGYHQGKDTAAGYYEDAKATAAGAYDASKKKAEGAYYDAEGKYHDAKHGAEKQYYDSKERAANAEGWAEEKVQKARENVGEKVKTAGSKIKGEL
ncbi:hypothetical protein DFP72DRAFT_538670 [Ephemerocybe angulata]|uniref:Uncharacterized protein n=1 Tax=Ephemerocybe angulata TaxID=980116 RepID=A0A8H6M270_9AGAR|nr:hypothetical protein DFP72DRAFT_538670 [Tulosesus angulatus]